MKVIDKLQGSSE